jgi:DNA-binding PucR family transcriptional regulator
MQALRRAAITGAAPYAGAVLGPLDDYDAAHGGDLVRTLAVYLTAGGNVSKAAEELFLHRSGMLYRLRRIEALCGVRLDYFVDRVTLEMAVLAAGLLDDQSRTLT